MAFITQSVMSGFQQGQQLGQQERQMQMLQEQQAQQQQAMEREQARKQRLSGLLGAYARGEQVLPDIASMGPEGIEAVKGLQGVMPEPQDPVEMFKQAYNVALSLPEDKQPEAFQAMIAAAVQRGFLTEEQGDTLSFATQKDPNSFKGYADRTLGLEKQEKRPPVGGVEVVVYPDGRREAFDVTDPGERSGYKAAIAAGAVNAPSRQEVGEPGAFDMSKKQREELKNAEISTAQAIATADDLLARIEKDPEAFSTAAAAAGLMSGLAAEVDAVSAAFGVDIPDDIKDASLYASTFEDLGIKNKQLQGLALDLGIAYASAIGLGEGRALSDKDVKRAMERIGAGGLATPSARKAAINDVRNILERNFKIRYERLTNKPYEGTFGDKRQEVATEKKTAAPSVGDEMGGYRYIGGDPSKPSSWEKL